MRLNTQELEFIRNQLLAKRVYRDTEIPLGSTVWEPYMEQLLTKVNNELTAHVL